MADDEVRLSLLRESYKEVLDATKHQDDKIGRILTAVAFLTAASLALANLTSGSLIARPFDVPHESIPLAVIALGVFLVLVVISVVLLVASLSTPLLIPGFRTPTRKSRISYANDVEASQIYFFEIAKVSLDEWRTKWHADSSLLRHELEPMYVEETYNLATRTQFKYDRTTEAVGTLALALFAFGLAAMLVIFAATSPTSRDVELDWLRRALLAAYFFAFTFIQLLSRARSYAQEIDKAVPPALRFVVFAAPLAVSLLLLPQRRCAGWVVYAAVVALTIAVYVCLWNSTSRRSRALFGSALLALLAGAGVAVAFGSYAWQFAVAVGAVVLTAVPSILRPTTERSKTLKKRHERQVG